MKKINDKQMDNKKEKINKAKTQAKIRTLYITNAITLVVVVILATLLSINSSNTALGQLINEGILARKINRLDINKDGMVDITDVIALKRHILSEMTGDTESDWYIADQEIDTDEPQDQTGETITKDSNISYQGYYADVDNDGTVDGVIYADLLAQSGISAKWSNDNGSYTIPIVTVEELKDYVISEIKHTESYFGTHDVIQMKNGSTGTERFYVMDLSDFTTDNYRAFSWYNNAYNQIRNYETITSTDFGAGRQNTIDIKRKWDYEEYGAKCDSDIWKFIGTEISKGWYLPSRGEWSAFLQYYGINQNNYSSYNLNLQYWSSSQGRDC